MHAAADIKFSCTQCGQRMLVDPAAAGHKTSCPGCDTEITVPTPESVITGGYAEAGQTPVEAFSSKEADEYEVKAGGADLDLTNRDSPSSANADHVVVSRSDWEEMHQQLFRAQEVSEHLELANAHLQTELRHREASHQTLEGELAFTRQRLLSAETQLGTSNRELSLSQGAVSQLEADLQKALADRDRIAGEQVSLEWKLTELEASLRNAEVECGRMNIAAEELLQVRSQISKIEWERDELRRECDQINRDLANTQNGRELSALRGREKALAEEKQRMAVALADALADATRFEQLNSKARTELEEMHRRFVAAEKRSESLSSSEVGRDNEILRGILARQKEELEQRYRELMMARRAKFGLRLAYWMFGVGALAVLAFAMQIIAGLF
jgi:chromosome segregation ATPase